MRMLWLRAHNHPGLAELVKTLLGQRYVYVWAQSWIISSSVKCQVKIKPFCCYHFDFSALTVQGFSRGDFISVAALFIQISMLAATAQLALPNCSQHHWSPSLRHLPAQSCLSEVKDGGQNMHCFWYQVQSHCSFRAQDVYRDELAWGVMAWERMGERSKVQLQLTLVISELVWLI